MNKYVFGLMVIFMILLGNIVANKTNKSGEGKMLTREEAIAAVKKEYPQFKNYPNDNLPQQVIESEQAPQGWYLQFRQEGSGIPIIEAHCYLVQYKGREQITKTGEYKGGDTTKTQLSISSCK